MAIPTVLGLGRMERAEATLSLRSNAATSDGGRGLSPGNQTPFTFHVAKRMDFGGQSGLMAGMSHVAMPFLSGRMMRGLTLAGLLLLVAGCATQPVAAPAPAKAKAAKLNAAVPPSYPVTKPGAKEITCQIQMIDGVMVSASDRLLPGHHRLVVAFGGTEGEFSGDVDLVIPEAKSYRLMAEKADESFTLALVEEESRKVVATSTAPIAPLMQFPVFVIQK